MFPFNLPGPTALYLTLLIVTLAAHAMLAGYVLAGTGFVALSARSKPEAGGATIAEVLKDWLPFTLGAAITAGVAPLLFVQILYAPNFYTANLLLGVRWMALIPILIAGFYLLYLQKTAFAKRASALVRGAIPALACGCFLYAGWSWTTNHLLSLAPATWPSAFVDGAAWAPAGALTRAGVWIGGAMVMTASLLAAQLAALPSDRPLAAGQGRRLAALGGAGLLITVAASATYLASVELRSAVMGPGGSYLALVAGGGVVQLVAWATSARSDRPRMVPGLIGSAAAIALGGAALREVIRVSSTNLVPLFPRHAQAAQQGGFTLFLIFLVFNALVIAAVVRTVQRARAAPASASTH